MFDKLKNHLNSFIKKTTSIISKEEPSEELKEEPKEPKNKKNSSLVDNISLFVKGEIILDDKLLEEPLEELELSLLSAGVEMSVASDLISSLKSNLSGKKIKKKDLNKVLKESLKEIISNLLDRKRILPSFDKKPYIIMFIGPNGAGKTTTIAKFIYMLKKQGKSVVVSASDTFRAAAIEQLEKHCEILDAKFIKGNYGADPTSVAFSALQYAKANHYDVLLIDTAGRQEMNKNLMNELKKMKRVINPDYTIYVSESIVGNAIVHQINTFKEIGIDAIILTKLDLDHKGGSIISVEKATGIPIIYFTNGQEYDKLMLFNKKIILDLIFSS